jgi:hypothetical protein
MCSKLARCPKCHQPKIHSVQVITTALNEEFSPIGKWDDTKHYLKCSNCNSKFSIWLHGESLLPSDEIISIGDIKNE